MDRTTATRLVANAATTMTTKRNDSATVVTLTFAPRVYAIVKSAMAANPAAVHATSCRILIRFEPARPLHRPGPETSMRVGSLRTGLRLACIPLEYDDHGAFARLERRTPSS